MSHIPGHPVGHREFNNSTKETNMEIAYINERIDRKLRTSTTVFCATKEKITEALNKILANKGLKPVVGKVNIGFKVKYPPYSFDVSAIQPRQ